MVKKYEGGGIIQFELDDWIILKKIFTNLNEIIDEIVIECNPEGLKFNALDRSHICFFGCNISKKLFDSYDIENILYLYLDVNDLVKVLKRGNNKDNLVFKANKEEVQIIFRNDNNRIFSIIQIDMEDNSREMPNMNYSVSFECDFNVLINCIKDAELYSDVLNFSLEDNLLVLSCEGHFGKYKNEYFLEESIGEEDCSASYGVDWLLRIFNTKLGSDKVIIHMGDNYPMLIGFNLEFIKMNYLLAPRINNE